MIFLINKLFISAIFNISLFLILILGTQNSTNKEKVNLIINESVKLPVGFIVGISFITGSITGSLLSTNFLKKK